MRTPFKWFGGKGSMTKKINSLLPPHDRFGVYCEPFCGAAAMYWHREPAACEVLNDLDGRIVNLFRCLQDPVKHAALTHRLLHTLYSVDELRLSIAILKDANASDLDKAWAFFVNQNQGFGGAGARSEGHWSRAFVSAAGMAETTNSWLMRLAMLPDWHKRIARCQIDNRDALKVISYWDSPDTLFYCDPPYVHSTRAYGSTSVYAVEPDDDFHTRMVAVILTCKGAVVLSGYDHPIYAPLTESGWDRMDFNVACHAATTARGSGLQGAGSKIAKVPRTESVWRNRAAVVASESGSMFAEADE